MVLSKKVIVSKRGHWSVIVLVHVCKKNKKGDEHTKEDIKRKQKITQWLNEKKTSCDINSIEISHNINRAWTYICHIWAFHIWLIDLKRCGFFLLLTKALRWTTVAYIHFLLIRVYSCLISCYNIYYPLRNIQYCI